MNPNHLSTSSITGSIRKRCALTTVWMQAVITDTTLLFSARLFSAAIFFQSGQTKINGLSLSDEAIFLFREEYRLPWLNSEFAAYLAAYAEHLFPALLVIGFATRLSALALLIMTLVIQFFVYPDAWPTHGTWGTLFLLMIAKGAGEWSIDHALSKRWQGMSE